VCIYSIHMHYIILSIYILYLNTLTTNICIGASTRMNCTPYSFWLRHYTWISLRTIVESLLCDRQWVQCSLIDYFTEISIKSYQKCTLYPWFYWEKILSSEMKNASRMLTLLDLPLTSIVIEISPFAIISMHYS